MPLHTDRDYEAELQRLRDRLLQMGGEVETMLAAAIRAFDDRDASLARQLIASDRSVNQHERDIDGLCIRILARRQPVASDLRLIATALKMVTDLERMGDLAKNICHRVVELAVDPPQVMAGGLSQTAVTVHGMVKDALDAFARADVERARAVIDRDNVVDAWYAETLHSLLSSMARHPEGIEPIMRVLNVAKYLERIADHATNVAEMVFYLAQGTDVRHAHNAMGPRGTER